MHSLIERYCVDCHGPEKAKGDLDLASVLSDDLSRHPDLWQNVWWMLEDREMPPTDKPNLPRPTEAEYQAATRWLDDALHAMGQGGTPAGSTETSELRVVDQYCTSCHSGEEAQSGLDLERLLDQPVHQHPEDWERIVRKMNAGQMPPLGRKRPDPQTYAAVIDFLERNLDEAAKANPNPGRTSTFRRLTRAEYENAIRDLLALEIDATELLPRDEVSHGFDTITVTDLTPTLLDRYISASQKIARLAMGSSLGYPGGDAIRVKPDLTQEKHLEGLPLGTRGGALIPYHFPRSGTYRIEIKLARDRNEEIEGMFEPQDMEILLNREWVKSFHLIPPKNKIEQTHFDKELQVEITVEAGNQELAVTFPKLPNSALVRKRKPYESAYNFHRHPRQVPAVYMVSIAGPLEDHGPGETASRDKIFGDLDLHAIDESAYARQVIERLARQAYRRPVTEEDLQPLMAFYQDAAALHGFEAGVEAGLRGILVNPNFLFRVERDPPGAQPGEIYKVTDLELASRLSFFLWSSLPDEALIALAEQGELSEPEVLKSQVLRLLADPRSESLIDQFAAQWLYLRNLESFVPNGRMFPDFDENLRRAMRRETELLFGHVMKEDLSVLELLTADYTFLNERLARHYGIPHVYGDRFRRVDLADTSHRGGLMRHASILTVTSYANRTSPVIRGNWILENIVGAPPPPPPPNVPALEDALVSESLPIRERLAAHRANPACSSCHELMDPIGFAMENFDAIGQWRWYENEVPIDASGQLASGAVFSGMDGLEKAILEHPENFVSTLVEKLLIFGLGRGIEYYDIPTVREIVRSAEQEDYTFSSLIIEIVASPPFLKRTVL